MKKEQLLTLVRQIVREEIQRELPNALAKVFKKLMVGKSNSEENPSPKSVQKEPEDNFSTKSLKEMFESEEPLEEQIQQRPVIKKFTSNPVLNEVLNQTTPFSGRDRFAMSANGGGMAAAMMASSQMGIDTSEYNETGIGQMMDESETSVPSAMPIRAETLPENISALDVKNHPGVPKSISKILNRDYRSLVKAMDKKK